MAFSAPAAAPRRSASCSARPSATPTVIAATIESPVPRGSARRTTGRRARGAARPAGPAPARGHGTRSRCVRPAWCRSRTTARGWGARRPTPIPPSTISSALSFSTSMPPRSAASSGGPVRSATTVVPLRRRSPASRSIDVGINRLRALRAGQARRPRTRCHRPVRSRRDRPARGGATAGPASRRCSGALPGVGRGHRRRSPVGSATACTSTPGDPSSTESTSPGLAAEHGRELHARARARPAMRATHTPWPPAWKWTSGCSLPASIVTVTKGVGANTATSAPEDRARFHSCQSAGWRERTADRPPGRPARSVSLTRSAVPGACGSLARAP